jgi:hypothetical protein
MRGLERGSRADGRGPCESSQVECRKAVLSGSGVRIRRGGPRLRQRANNKGQANYSARQDGVEGRCSIRGRGEAGESRRLHSPRATASSVRTSEALRGVERALGRFVCMY